MRTLTILSVSILALSSCVVSKKKYDLLNSQKSQLEVEKALCQGRVDSLSTDTTAMGEEIRSLQGIYEGLVVDTAKLGFQLSDLNGRHKKLMKNASKDAQNLSKQLQKVGQLNHDLEQKEKELAERDNLLKEKEAKAAELQTELASREEKVKQLESLLNAQQDAMASIRKKIDKALHSFNSDELTVTEHDGNLYVTLSQNLLFKSGSYNVDDKGKKALNKIAKALKDNNDLDIVVEGHTDDVPMRSSGPISDNWDLSVKRATSITKILIESGLDPTHVMAGGRGEHKPKVNEKTEQARAVNRRTEIIISPKLSILSDILKG